MVIHCTVSHNVFAYVIHKCITFINDILIVVAHSKIQYIAYMCVIVYMLYCVHDLLIINGLLVLAK